MPVCMAICSTRSDVCSVQDMCLAQSVAMWVCSVCTDAFSPAGSQMCLPYACWPGMLSVPCAETGAFAGRLRPTPSRSATSSSFVHIRRSACPTKSSIASRSSTCSRDSSSRTSRSRPAEVHATKQAICQQQTALQRGQPTQLFQSLNTCTTCASFVVACVQAIMWAYKQ